jgi:hypothetical protein
MATTYRGDNHEQDSEHSSEELSCDGSEYESDHNQMMDELDGSESTYDMKNNDRKLFFLNFKKSFAFSNVSFQNIQS